MGPTWLGRCPYVLHAVLRGLCGAGSYLADASVLVSLGAVMHDCITSTWQERVVFADV